MRAPTQWRNRGVSDYSIRRFYGNLISAFVEALNRNGSAGVDAARILEEVYVRSSSFVPGGEISVQEIQVESSNFMTYCSICRLDLYSTLGRITS